MTHWPEFIRAHLARPVAILGWGVSGKAVAAAVRSAGGRYKCYDQGAPAGAMTAFTAADARQHGLVVHSPGFAPEHPWLATAREAGCLCLGEADLGALLWQGGLVAITGTNGKTTLTEFLAHALNTIGARARACGNLGLPLTALHDHRQAEQTIAVCEVSSFQAEALAHFNPHAVLWTNFAEDHLDRHGSMGGYFAAKWRLVERLRRPRLVLGESVAAWARGNGNHLPPFTVIARADEAPAPPPGSVFDSVPQRENWALARAYWHLEGFAPKLLEEAARTFALPRHRFAKVAEREEVSFWNDSKATNFAATEAALASFGRPVLWIGGGRAKGGELAAFARAIAPKLRAGFLIGQSAPALAAALEQHGARVVQCQSMGEAVERAWAVADAGDAIVLSPGFSSHDLFANYAERGQAFEQAVADLGAPCGHGDATAVEEVFNGGK